MYAGYTLNHIGSGWPHQIALRAEATYGERYVAARLFCESLSLCPRGHCFVGEGGYLVTRMEGLIDQRDEHAFGTSM
jgi:hypothetical protein